MAAKKRKELAPGELTWQEKRALDEAYKEEILNRRYANPVVKPERAELLDATALKVNLAAKTLNADALRVRNTLGLPAKKWNDAKMRAIRELGEMEYLKISARVLMVTGFSSVEQIEEAIKLGRSMMANPNLTASDRIAAGTMVSKCAHALAEMSKELMSLAEKGSEREEGPAKRPKNLPPPVAVQVNFTGPPSPAPGVAVLVPERR